MTGLGAARLHYDWVGVCQAAWRLGWGLPRCMMIGLGVARLHDDQEGLLGCMMSGLV